MCVCHEAEGMRVLTWLVQLDANINAVVDELAVNLAHILDNARAPLRLQIEL